MGKISTLKRIFTYLLLFQCFFCKAQSYYSSQSSPFETEQKVENNGNAFEIGISTIGITADFQHRFGNYFAYRIGGTFLPGFHHQDVSSFATNPKDSSTSLLDIDLNSMHLLFEVTPFGGSGFRLVTGMGYFAAAKGSITTTKNNGITVGLKKYSPSEVGSVSTTIDYSGFAPYLGIGLLRGVPKNNFNINLDLGTYFLGNPTLTQTGTGLLNSNNTETTGADLLKQLIVNNWKFLPVLQMNLNFKL